ncbi:hypothetical protein BDN72DRAFT_807125 [Pluteus cervinus]|uniref:Uncharacterized protein n=1 Tax=Pluteus cervinus TaxID=181527 RepID=A0ACD3BFK8_9AGAR|nr:hypothetical protein BDN72DRAFT_807125 [Pluteus cervinus]
MSSRRPSPAPKRTVPIKRADGDPLTRVDIQYDVLNAIFNDSRTVFTNPYVAATQENPPPKLTFHDLYIKAVLNSSKATKALRDKMNDSSLFAEDFAMLAMLVNVGRINTTMSFFPEMKTAIRTYHPIPALQRSNGNLQDAPRIKHILKASLLEGETKNAPSTPSDVLARGKAGQVPATSIMNLIFVLANHSVPVGHQHFPEQSFDFLDIFLRTDISSASRARAFLYLCYHYLESSTAETAEDDYDGEAATNPFTDSNRGKGPILVVITPAEVAKENVEPEDERIRKENLVAQRSRIVSSQSKGKAAAGGDEDEEMAGSGAEETKPKAGGSKRTTAHKEKKATTDKVRKKAVKSKRHVESGDEEDISAQSLCF